MRENIPAAIGLGLFLVQAAYAGPPFGGTIFLDPNIITEADPTTYQKIEDAGRGQRTMFDRRANWVYLNAFLFNASFSDGPNVEIQVNPEFGDVDTARAEALKYAPVIGRLPRCIREDVETVWIHKGNNPFGGGNDNLLIHTGQAEQYSASEILEETLVHEGSHTSLDGEHANTPGWLAAQAADGAFISTYARDNPTREDIAETFLVYFALRYRPGRISQSLADTISQTIPNRIAYFDSQELGFSALGGEASENSWGLATDHGSGWKSLDWFGYYHETPAGWIYHAGLGWLYRESPGIDSIWLYFPNHGWMWTSQSIHPYFYDSSTDDWTYFRSGEDKPRFYHYGTKTWTTRGE